MLTQEDKRKKIRAQLVKEWNAAGSTSKKPKRKQSVSLCKKESSRLKFLKNPKNKPEPGDKITYMTALKKKPKHDPGKILTN